MLRATSTGARLPPESATWRFDARPDVTRLDDRQGEVLEAARPRRGSRRDPRLLVRAAAPAAPEREARRRGRRHGEEAPPNADGAARTERRQAGDAGAAGPGRGPRGPRAAGARAEVGRAAAAPGARPAGARARGSDRESRRRLEAAPAADAGDEESRPRVLDTMASSVRDSGERLPDDDLSASDLIIPPDDLSLEEAKELFSGEGLIPDLPG